MGIKYENGGSKFYLVISRIHFLDLHSLSTAHEERTVRGRAIPLHRPHDHGGRGEIQDGHPLVLSPVLHQRRPQRLFRHRHLRPHAKAGVEALQAIHQERHTVRHRSRPQRDVRPAGGQKVRRALSDALRQGEEAGDHHQPTVQARLERGQRLFPLWPKRDELAVRGTPVGERGGAD